MSKSHFDILPGKPSRPDGGDIGLEAEEKQIRLFREIAMQKRIYIFGVLINIHHIAPDGVVIPASIAVDSITHVSVSAT